MKNLQNLLNRSRETSQSKVWIFDCTCVMLQSKWGNYGKFNGEKLELEHFIKRYKSYSFEIVDELYGYNQVLYSGYLSILETEDLVQMDISIYFTGKIIYDTKE